MTDQDPLAHICPVCGESNLCQVVADRGNKASESGQQCWCMAEPRKRAVPVTISNDKKRCLCQRCLKQAQAQQ